MLGQHAGSSFREALGAVALAVPDRVALDDGSRALTYSELVDAVAAAAAVVAKEAGAPVTVVMEHTSDAIVALLGVMAAGRIAVPVDPRDPLDRLRAIHRDAGSSLVVTGRYSIDAARALAAGAPVLVTDELDVDIASAHTSRGADAFDPARPAMLLFTSGSTGSPKGVTISGGGIVAHALQVARSSALTPDDRIAVPGSLAFGATQSRIRAALVSGARACLFDLRERGAGGLPDWVNANGITVMFFVPSVLRALLDTAPDAYMGTVRLVTFGGEALYGRDTRRARALFGPDTVFRNRLSSSETHGMAGRVVTAADDERDGVIPVGEVEPWLEARIVDDEGDDVAEGEVGRLVVIGRDFALDYWNDPALTAERFADLPDGRRAFTTSDLVRRLDDRSLLHVARADSRVKVRGAMVATSEVEAALTSLPDVADAAVVGVPADDGGTRLVAYVVARPGTALGAWKLRRDLAERLPSTSVPSAFVPVDALPRTLREKVDRQALPPPPPAVQTRPYREPAGSERDLADIFARVLGVEPVGLDDDFFDLGGDSLGVVELLAEIAERFSVDLPASTVLDAPTVAELSLRLSHRRPRDASPVVMLRSDAEGPPLFCVTGGGAPAISLRNLSDAIGDRNFGAIQPRWPRGAGDARPQRPRRRAAQHRGDARRATQRAVHDRRLLLRWCRRVRDGLSAPSGRTTGRLVGDPRHQRAREYPKRREPRAGPLAHAASRRAIVDTAAGRSRRDPRCAVRGPLRVHATRSGASRSPVQAGCHAAGTASTTCSCGSTPECRASTRRRGSSTVRHWSCAATHPTGSDREPTIPPTPLAGHSPISAGPSSSAVLSPPPRYLATTSTSCADLRSTSSPATSPAPSPDASVRE